MEIANGLMVVPTIERLGCRPQLRPARGDACRNLHPVSTEGGALSGVRYSWMAKPGLWLGFFGEVTASWLKDIADRGCGSYKRNDEGEDVAAYPSRAWEIIAGVARRFRLM